MTKGTGQAKVELGWLSVVLGVKWWLPQRPPSLPEAKGAHSGVCLPSMRTLSTAHHSHPLHHLSSRPHLCSWLSCSRLGFGAQPQAHVRGPQLGPCPTCSPPSPLGTRRGDDGHTHLHSGAHKSPVCRRSSVRFSRLQNAHVKLTLAGDSQGHME